MLYLLFNPLANNKRGEQDAQEWAKKQGLEPTFKSVIGLNFCEFFSKLKKDDEVILTGGDGTLNWLVNDIEKCKINNPLYYVKCGSGNDFYRDVEHLEKDGKVDLKPFIRNLPFIEVAGLKRRFINGIGYGVDGDTCLVGDQIRKENPDAVINYSKIAVKLLLTSYQTKNCKVIVDGKEHEFKNVWVAATMNGRFYGGGINAAPKQDRLNNNGTVTLTVLSSKGRLRSLLRFPTFSSGKHDKKKYITSFVGKKITVIYDAPCALQIDGEVVPDVTTYTVQFGY